MRLTIRERNKYFSQTDHQIAVKILLLFLVSNEGQKRGKSEFVTKHAGIIASYFHVKVLLK